MFKKLVLISIVFLYTSSLSFAQTNFKKGYILVSAGDTLKGIIDDRGDFRNSQVVYYRSSKDAQIKEFQPTEVIGYKVGSKVYRSATLNVEDKQVVHFLELMNDGSLKIFYLRDKTNLIRLFAHKDSVFYELKNEQRKVKEGDKVYAYNSNNYLGVLSSLTSDCTELDPNNVAFSLKSISKFAAIYNECKGDNVYSSDKPDRKPLIAKTVFAGINSSDVVTTNAFWFQEATKHTGLTAGVGIHLNFPSINNKFFLDLVAAYNQKGAVAEKERITFDLHYINFMPGLSYVYPKGKIRPTVGAAFVGGVLLNEASAFSRIRYGERIRMFNTPGDNSSGNELGYEGKAGIKYVISPKFQLLFKLNYSKTLIRLSGGKYQNEVISFQTGIEF